MNCLQCGQLCPPSKRARPRRFCCDAHRIAFNNARRTNRVNYPADPVKKAISRKRYKKSHPEVYRKLKRKWYHKYAESIWFRKLLKRKGILTPEQLDVWLARREAWNRGKKEKGATGPVQTNPTGRGRRKTD